MLVKRSEIIIFVFLLATFEVDNIFLGSFAITWNFLSLKSNQHCQVTLVQIHDTNLELIDHLWNIKYIRALYLHTIPPQVLTGAVVSP